MNEKGSVTLCLFDRHELIHVGNVMITPKHGVPAVGQVVEVRYLNAFRESGSIYQPVYLGKRCDILQCDCTTDQLKYRLKQNPSPPESISERIHGGRPTRPSATGKTQAVTKHPMLRDGRPFTVFCQ